MGRCPNNKAGGRKKKYSHKQARRTKFLKKGDDMVFDEVRRQALVDEAVASGAVAALAAGRAAGGSSAPPDDDLPGMGQWYCLYCDRHFASAAVKEEHNKTKQHKKRIKLMESGPRPHCQLDAELAAGMGLPDNGLRGKQAGPAAPVPMIS